jgi:C4-dicarboxylate transporter DctQ subunit
MHGEKFSVKTFLNNIELYLGTICFIILTIMLTLQVVSRYVLKNSFTWMEEFATIMFVWMIYFGVSAAVTKRKHLRIDFVLDLVPYKVKKAMLILSNVIFAIFNVYISTIMANIISLMGTSKTTMLHWPQKVVYSIIPIALLISVIRLVQDTIRLYKEDESNLGTSKPSMDLDECEAIYKAKVAAKKKGAE